MANFTGVLNEMLDVDMTKMENVLPVLREMLHLLSHGPRSRERSIVITKLEETILWAQQVQKVEV